MYNYDVVNGVVKKVSLTERMRNAEKISLEAYVLANFNSSTQPTTKMKRMALLAETTDKINVRSLEKTAYSTLANVCLSTEASVPDTIRNTLNWMNTINNYTSTILDGLKMVDKTYSVVSSNAILNTFTSNKDKLDVIIRSVNETVSNKPGETQTGYTASPELVAAMAEITKFMQMKNAPISFKDYVTRVCRLIDTVNKAFTENDNKVDITVASEDLVNLFTAVDKTTEATDQTIVYNADSFIQDYNVLMNSVDYTTKTNIKKILDFMQNTTKRIGRLKDSYTGEKYNLVVATQTVLNLITYVCYYYEKHLKLNAYMKSLSDSLMYVNI